MSSIDLLLADIEAFLRQTGMKETAFGIAAVNDGHLVRDLRSGKSVTLRRQDKIRSFIDSHKPRQKPRSRQRRRQCSGAAAA